MLNYAAVAYFMISRQLLLRTEEHDQNVASRIRMFRPDPARKLYDIYHCCVYSEKLLVMDRGTVRNT